MKEILCCQFYYLNELSIIILQMLHSYACKYEKSIEKFTNEKRE